jgi:general secretion pathway protein D
MTRSLLSCTALLALALPASAQDARPESRAGFAFQEASVDAVLRYVSRLTGWVFVMDVPPRGTITAVSDGGIPLSRCLDFLNACLRKNQLFVLNPAAPGAPRPGEILHVIDLSKADRFPAGVHVGLDPREIPLTAEPWTQMIPLKSANATDAGKDFGEVFHRLLGDGGQLAISSYSNSILASGSAEGVRRVVEVLQVIDQTAAVQIRLAVIPLEHTDAVETAKTLNDVFKREATRPETGAMPRLPGFLRGFDGAPAAPKAAAYEAIRITADPRTNSIIAGASEETMAVLRSLVEKLDQPSAEIRTYVVPLTSADASNVAALLNALWRNPAAPAAAARTGQPRSDGTLSPGQTPFGGSSVPSGSLGPAAGGTRR